jgi:hypothetical protein
LYRELYIHADAVVIRGIPMRTAISIVLLFLTLFSCQCYAQSGIILAIHTSENPLDTGDSPVKKRYLKDIRDNFKIADVPLEIVEVDLSADQIQLIQSGGLPDVVAEAAQNRMVLGIIFFGHGNDKRYSLNRNSSFDGEELAVLTKDIVEKLQRSDHFVISFSGCRLGQDSFQETFANKLYDVVDNPGAISVTAMPEITTPSTFKRPLATTLELFFYKTFGRVISKFTTPIIYTFGNEAQFVFHSLPILSAFFMSIYFDSQS